MIPRSVKQFCAIHNSCVPRMFHWPKLSVPPATCPRRVFSLCCLSEKTRRGQVAGGTESFGQWNMRGTHELWMAQNCFTERGIILHQFFNDFCQAQCPVLLGRLLTPGQLPVERHDRMRNSCSKVRLRRPAEMRQHCEIMKIAGG